MKIAIIGAGNMGTAVAADLSRKNEVSVFSSKPHLFADKIKYVDSTTGESYKSRPTLVSSEYDRVLEGAELVLITLPTPVIQDVISKIEPIVDRGTVIGYLPGAGGVEFLSAPLIEKGCCIFGFERVPYVARLQEYGRIVSASKKDRYRIAVFPKNAKKGLEEEISRLFNRPCVKMDSFLSMTLTPTLHTSRLYDLYADYKMGDLLPDNPFFYGEWRDSASEICLQLDDELHSVTDTLSGAGLDITDLVPYRIHYESPDVQSLTIKLRSIQSLNKIKGPVIENADGSYSLDLESRYFTESFPYRLAIVKGLAELVKKEVPKTTEVMMWYAKLKNKEYFTKGSFGGKDISECNIPQNKGIRTLKDLIDYYSPLN